MDDGCDIKGANGHLSAQVQVVPTLQLQQPFERRAHGGGPVLVLGLLLERRQHEYARAVGVAGGRSEDQDGRARRPKRALDSVERLAVVRIRLKAHSAYVAARRLAEDALEDRQHARLRLDLGMLFLRRP